MGPTTLLVSVALATVFVVSGLAKLLDRDGTRQAVTGFGVPGPLVPIVAAGLAPAEILTAVLLLVPVSSILGLMLALALLVGFTAAVLLALRAGRQVECHCFGRIGGADISLRTVARNTLLGALAVIGLVAAASPEQELTGGEAVGGVLAGLVLAASVVAGEGLAGRAARARKDKAAEETYEQGVAAAGGPVAAPAFTLPALAGGEQSLGTLTSAGLPLLLVFMAPGCGPCKAMRPAVARWVDAYQDRLRVVVVSRNGREENAAAFHEWPNLEVLFDEDGAVTKVFDVDGTPSAVLVDTDGNRRGGLAGGERLVRRLLAAALSGDQPELQGHEPDEAGEQADSIDLGSVVAPRSTVTRHGPDEEAVLVDEATGAGASLDQIGGIVWSLLDGSSPLREIVADLADAFGAPQEVVGRDVLAMVRSLGRAGLLEGIRAEPVSDSVEPVTETAHAH